MDDGLLILGGAVALWLLSKANTAQSLQFQPTGASWDGGSLQVQIGVLNPTAGDLTLNALSGSLAVNGNNVGIVGLPPGDLPKVIAPQTTTPVILQYTPNYLGLLFTLLNDLKQSGQSLSIAYTGSANVNGITLPVNLHFQAAIP